MTKLYEQYKKAADFFAFQRITYSVGTPTYRNSKYMLCELMQRCPERFIDIAHNSTKQRIYSTLQAIRPICRYEDCATYLADIEAIADKVLPRHVVVEMLESSGFTDDEISDWFGCAADNEYVVTEDGRFGHIDDFESCNACEQYFHDASMGTVHAEYGGESWCENCRDRNAFLCDISGEWYSLDDFGAGETEDGETICAERAEELGYEWDEDEDRYFHADSRHPRIPEYHRGNRMWSLSIPNVSVRRFFGFEIELDFEDPERRYEFYETYIRDSFHFAGEIDGSLDRNTSMEIITRPFSMEELQMAGNKLQLLMHELAEAGAEPFDADYPEANYGVHITMNWGDMRAYARHCMLNNLVTHMKDLSIFVAGREPNTYCQYTTDTRNKHNALYDRGAAAEVRIFDSTADYERLMSYMEYVDALATWSINPHNNAQDPVQRAAFRRWACEQPQYQHFANRLLIPRRPVPNVHSNSETGIIEHHTQAA